ncbi:MAG: DUF1543 domain-containing protein [Bacteroidetes bacterium]|nr:DUF1543 domain-containing protein [Bacteroidota bacterium]
MDTLKLFMLLLGCKPNGRHTEQHDIFFGIGRSLKDLKEDMHAFWPEANQKLHLDGWREITRVDGYAVNIFPRNEKPHNQAMETKLFFLNLGGYKQNEFEEYHYKMIVACKEKEEAIYRAKQTAFYRHTGFEGAPSHIDDKYGIDVDDIYEIEDILPEHTKKQFFIALSESTVPGEDELHPGYLKLEKL